MRRARSFSVACVAGLVCSCGLFDRVVDNTIACHSDSECPAGNVCFPDGCGDPGQNIAVEVTPNAAAGENAQDFLVPQLSATENLQLFAPTAVAGTVSVASGNGQSSPFSGTMQLSLVGGSTLIPGVARAYQGTVNVSNGAYTMPIGAGSFVAAAIMSDSMFPPVGAGPLTAGPGAQVALDWPLPDPSSLVTISGQVIATEASPALSSTMQVQAFDPQSLLPLSQTSTTAVDGSFSLTVSGASALQTSLTLLVTPTSAVSALPQVAFELDRGQNDVTLELGDFGVPFTVNGVVLSADGATPLEGATVYLLGAVGGGGLFVSASAQTGAAGEFLVTTLPSDPAQVQPMTLWVVPSAGVLSGTTTWPLDIAASTPDLGTFPCNPRVHVTGSTLRPDGSDFAGVRVTAVPLASVPGFPLPTQGAQSDSDPGGNFSLYLEPATYQLNLQPPEQLPQISRDVTIDGSSAEAPQQPYTLSKGRTVTGTVMAPQTLTSGLSLAPYAQVRFFRLTETDGGVPSSLLLAAGIADANASYSVIIPTR